MAMSAASGADIGGGIGSLVGGGLLLAGAAGEGGEKYYKQALELWEKLQEPNFDFRELSAPELKMLAEMTAQTYEGETAAPVTQVEGSPEMRESQMRALAQMEEMAREGLPLEDRLAAEGAQRQVMEGARAPGQSLARELRARGRTGGTEAVLRSAQNQQSSNLARDLGSDLQRQALQRRLMAAEQSGSFAGATRGQDIMLSQSRADVANRYNEFLSGLRTQAARDAAGARERAQGYNVGTTQRIGDTNVMNRYGTQLSNLQRTNQLEQAKFGASLQKTQGLAGAYTGFGQYEDAERDRRAQAIQQMATGAGSAAGPFMAGGF